MSQQSYAVENNVYSPGRGTRKFAASKLGPRAGLMLLCGLVMAVTPALADPLTWTFTNAFMHVDTEAVTGSFVFDADTQTVLAFDFTTAAGGNVGTSFEFDMSDAQAVVIAPYTIEFNQFAASSPAPPVAAVFDLWLTQPGLTDSGGVLQLAGTNTSLFTNNQPQQSDTFLIFGKGTLVASGSTPEPGTAGLLVVGVGLLAAARWRKRFIA